MRDLRPDLEERASLLQQQIRLCEVRHRELVERLTKEHQARLDVLRAEHGAVAKLIGIATWHHNLHTAVRLAITVTDVITGASKPNDPVTPIITHGAKMIISRGLKIISRGLSTSIVQNPILPRRCRSREGFRFWS